MCCGQAGRGGNGIEEGNGRGGAVVERLGYKRALGILLVLAIFTSALFGRVPTVIVLTPLAIR